jgi:isopentenyl diphosphate isomerase/L-lactate dehydrogenase-like FMN-dependent dehydrogenase
VIKILNEELKEAMLESGCYSLNDIKKNNILYKPNELLFAKL